MTFSTAARALLTGWVLWFSSLLWLFPHVSRYFFPVRQIPKPFEITSPAQSPNFNVSGVGVSISWSNPIDSLASVLWLPVAAPRGIYETGLSDPGTFMFGIVLPFVVAVVCGGVVALFHRRLKRESVFLFAATIALVNLLLFVRFAVTVSGAAAYALARPLWFYIAISVIGILLGGELIPSISQREGK